MGAGIPILNGCLTPKGDDVMNNSTQQSKQANTQKRYEVTSADLPLHCPMDGMRNWDSHPRVSLSIKRGEEVQCPYCGATYVLK